MAEGEGNVAGSNKLTFNPSRSVIRIGSHTAPSVSVLLLGASLASAQPVALAERDTITAARIDTVAPSTVVETSYPFSSGTLELPGTLTLPAKVSGKIPVVLIVAGSGPTDRNGNSGGPLRAQNNSNLYAILAWQLAERGIASVRYDKRIIGDNLTRVDLAATSIDDFVGDVAAGARALAGDARFSRVVLLGHSEGAQLVLQAANRGAAVAGIVMAAGAGRPINVILHEQMSKQFPAAEMVKWDSAFARYARGEEPGDLHQALRPLLLPQYRKFMQDWVKYIPTDEIAKVKVPVLVVQGGRDLQVSEVDARALRAAQPAAALIVIPAANHVFRAAASDDRMAQLRLYTDPTIPIVPELAPTIADWIKALR
ncbi:MAG: alpha/beta fold hydrolase [Gemmatimonadaceae bacterium]